MKKITLLFTIISAVISAQDLTITVGNSMTIENGALLYLNGIALQPTTNYNLSGPKTISKSTTPINAQSINKVYDFSTPMLNYEGSVVLSYKDSELKSIPESNLVLLVKDISDHYILVISSLNTTTNKLNYTFSSPTDIYGFTATDKTTLRIDNFDNVALQIFPNPVVSTVIIEYKNAIEVEVYNILGSSILKTKSKSIDVSRLNSGTYLFKITDLQTNKTTIRKIIKK